MKEQGKKIMETENTKDVEIDLEKVGDKVVGGSDHARVREGKRSGRGSGNIRLVRSNHARVHLSDHARVREGKPRRTIMELEGEG